MFCLVIGLFFGWYPAGRAGKLEPYRGTTIRIISELFDDRLRVVVEKPSDISQQCNIGNHRVRTIQLGDIGQHNMRSNTGDGAHWGRG